jgi:acetylornithine deacetylase/succinyl-diaminopimelate desuccinylase-like protein
VAELLRAAGADPAIDATGNVVARFGPPDRPATVLAAHLDTVFGPEVDVTPARDGDLLRGPGIGDDSLAVAVGFGSASFAFVGKNTAVAFRAVRSAL